MDPKKKRLTAGERDEEARQAWRTLAATFDVRKLVVLDECGTHLDLTRTYAYAPRGQRAIGVVPRNRGRSTTLLASLSVDGIGPSLTLSGGVTCEAFWHYISAVLAPTLAPGQIVVLDNLGVHHDPRVRTAIEARGATLHYLPTYSPDLSPIELAFSKVKATLRRLEARSRPELETAIGTALSEITPQDAVGWFTHCGYPLHGQLIG